MTKVHVHDPTKALLAVVVPLLSAAVLGVALIVAFAQSSGAPPYKPAAVSPPSLPALSSGAAPGTNHLCAPRERLPTSLPPGSGVVTISPDSTSVTALWLPGLDPSDCQAAITRGGRALAVELAAALDGEPAVGTGIYACPLDNGSSVVLYFGYGEGRASEAVSVALSGCRFISDPGRKSRWWLKPGRAPLNFGQLLARLAPNPWRSNILTALQAS